MRKFLLLALHFGGTIHAQDLVPTDDALSIPPVEITSSPSQTDEGYVMDLVESLKQAKKQKKMVILYTGHDFHLKRIGTPTPRSYFDRLVKSSASLTARRSEFIVCEIFEFSAMHDAKGNFTPEYAKMINGWFGTLHNKYDIRFLTPTVNFLDSNGVKLAGPFEGMQGFGEGVDNALKTIPPIK